MVQYHIIKAIVTPSPPVVFFFFSPTHRKHFQKPFVLKTLQGSLFFNFFLVLFIVVIFYKVIFRLATPKSALYDIIFGKASS